MDTDIDGWGGKLIRRAINGMDTQTVNTIVPTSRRVQAPTIETDNMMRSLEKGIKPMYRKQEFLFIFF